MISRLVFWAGLMMAAAAIPTAGAQSAGTAGVDLVVNSFLWRASGRFDLRVRAEGAEVALRGDLREGGDAEVKDGALSAVLKSYPGFISVILTEDGYDLGTLFILERQNAQYVVLNKQAVVGRAATLAPDLSSALEGLNKAKGWDASLSFRALISYFREAPAKKLGDFADDVELGRINTVAKPPTRVTTTAPTAGAGDGGGQAGGEYDQGGGEVIVPTQEELPPLLQQLPPVENSGRSRQDRRQRQGDMAPRPPAPIPQGGGDSLDDDPFFRPSRPAVRPRQGQQGQWIMPWADDPNTGVYRQPLPPPGYYQD